MAAKWKGKIIGKYKGPGLPDPTQCDIAANKLNWGLMNRLVERTVFLCQNEPPPSPLPRVHFYLKFIISFIH